jgi:hypothetical protein
VGSDIVFTPPLSALAAIAGDPLWALDIVSTLATEFDMDFIFIAAGVALFAAFAGYAALLRRI